MEWLKPKFDDIPAELIKIDRWLVWRNKVPYNAKTKKKADSTDPSQWESFELAKSTYENGGFDGVGFALDNDEIIGIDLDNCVIDGKPREEAEKLLEGLDVGYIELSPSGNGLHAFGYGLMLQGRTSQIDGLSVEIYPNKRYLTFTGHALKKEPLRPLVGLESVLQRMGRLTEDTEVTEETDSGSSASSVSSVSESTQWPRHVIPTGYGQRRTKIFELARWLKGTEPEASNARQKDFLRQWYLDHRHIFRTQEFEVSWVDWINGWHRVKYPYGAQLEAALQNLAPLPSRFANEGLGPKETRLLQICIALQSRESAGCPFFISCRKAGNLIEMDHSTTASLLSSFVIRGYLELVEKGSGKKASRYKLKLTLAKSEASFLDLTDHR
jgi:hypothetical protein